MSATDLPDAEYDSDLVDDIQVTRTHGSDAENARIPASGRRMRTHTGESSLRSLRPSRYVIRRLAHIMKAPFTFTHVVVALLLLAFGFSMVNQLATTSADNLNRLSETDLVQLLDELRTRNIKVTQEHFQL